MKTEDKAELEPQNQLVMRSSKERIRCLEQTVKVQARAIAQLDARTCGLVRLG